MKTIRVAKASNIQLDWLVGRAGGGGKLPIWQWIDGRSLRGMFCYTTNWSQMGPIIERERIDVISDPNGTAGWMGRNWSGGAEVRQFAATALIAAARCYVSSKLGEEVEIPEELE